LSGSGNVAECYPHTVRKKDLIAFVRRDWRAVAALKRERWAHQESRMAPAERLAVGDELRRHVAAFQESWPTEQDRRSDLASHLRVSEMLRRVQSSHRR
jgi:hypothetical protein